MLHIPSSRRYDLGLFPLRGEFLTLPYYNGIYHTNGLNHSLTTPHTPTRFSSQSHLCLDSLKTPAEPDNNNPHITNHTFGSFLYTDLPTYLTNFIIQALVPTIYQGYSTIKYTNISHLVYFDSTLQNKVLFYKPSPISLIFPSPRSTYRHSDTV